MKIVTIIGARPQFIKAATVSRAISLHCDIEEIILHTGQHYDDNMSRIFFEELDIRMPKYNLDINALSHGAMTGRMLEGIESILQSERADMVLVYGDTNSTLAGALAASKMNIPVAHIEAGLRSYNMQMPEEINRILTDRISRFLFCPTDTAVENLMKEGFGSMDCKVIKAGDVMYDASVYYSAKAKPPAVDLPSRFVLATLHRAENTDNIDRLSEIMDAFATISDSLPVVLPLHPRTRSILSKNNLLPKNNGVWLIDPVGYLNMIYLLNNTSLVMTDSGGLQKEAYFFKKPCITLRDETEWVELLNVGANKLAGANKTEILKCFHDFLSRRVNFPTALYGDGNAAMQIVNFLNENF